MDPVAAIAWDAGQRLNLGAGGGGGLTCWQPVDEVSLFQSQSLKLKRVTDL